MESKYNIENFEKFLREKTDEFRMYPSKRVWYSIYNNMHPGNRMPSISMCIVLICSLLLAGYLNTGTHKDIAANTSSKGSNNLSISVKRNIHNQADKETALYATDQQTFTPDDLYPQTASTLTKHTVGSRFNRNDLSAVVSLIAQNNSVDIARSKLHDNTGRRTSTNSTGLNTGNTVLLHDIADRTVSPHSSEVETAVENSNNVYFNNRDRTVVTASNNEHNEIVQAADNSTAVENDTKTISASNNTEIEKTIKNTPASNTEAGNTKSISAITNLSSNNSVVTGEKNDTNTEKQEVAKSGNTKITSMSVSDKMWIENFALYNRPVPKKWAGKVSWQAYVTPSVVYRRLFNNTANKALNGNGNGNFNNADIDNVVIQKPSFGLETGLSLQYDLLKILKVKAGVQLNYTRYNSHAFENHHPIGTSLTMNSDDNNTPYETFRSTPYSNMYGLDPVKLHNETYQLSLPVGADLKLFSNNMISWYAGATIQPTLVIYGRSYLISSDRRNYVKDASMLNRFNLNAGFETYLSFKTSSYTWQVGPQFRSQILSTNSSVYSVEERLMNYGFKIGITRKL